MARNLGLYCQGHSISEPRCLLSSRLTVREARMEPLSPVLPPSKQDLLRRLYRLPTGGPASEEAANTQSTWQTVSWPHTCLPSHAPAHANFSQAYKAHGGCVLMGLKPRTGPRPHSRVIGPDLVCSKEGKR